MAHDHADNVPPSLIGIPAGQDKDSEKFQEQYEIVTKWDVNCAACCWTYLTKERHYTTCECPDTRVTYGQADKQWTRCYISPKQENTKHGQFKTKKETELYGRPVAGLLIKNNSTFQLYSKEYTPEPTVIGTTNNVVTRVESIAVHCVIDQNINGSCLSYNNATILELYRAKNQKPALQGVCETAPHADEAAGIKAVTTADTQVKREMK